MEPLKVSINGTCVPVLSNKNPSIVLPKNITNYTSANMQDCICPVILKDDCSFSKCHCINDTVFSEYLDICIESNSSSNYYYYCFPYGLSLEMNNTLIHIFDSFRSCINDTFDIPITKSYRDYHKSFRILIGMDNVKLVSCRSIMYIIFFLSCMHVQSFLAYLKWKLQLKQERYILCHQMLRE